jgi:SAM-dependent methyltransferase
MVSSNVFDVDTIEQAKKIILTPIGDHSTESRWQNETEYLLSILDEFYYFDEYTIVLDYGCGIGRMAKALIQKYDCHVVGVDTSPAMRALAIEYVSSKKFTCCAPEDLGPNFVDVALAIWVLQHCPDVERDIALIRKTLLPYAGLFVVNGHKRYLPTENGWVDDGKNIYDMLNVEYSKQIPSEYVGDVPCFWATTVREKGKHRGQKTKNPA